VSIAGIQVKRVLATDQIPWSAVEVLLVAQGAWEFVVVRDKATGDVHRTRSLCRPTEIAAPQRSRLTPSQTARMSSFESLVQQLNDIARSM
jgi:hypothetical protein